MNPNTWLRNELKKWNSLLKKLRQEGKTNEQFEILLNNLTLEEVIAAKLELSSRTLKTPLYGLPLWKHMPEIVEDAVLMYAIAINRTPAEAASYLGMTPYKFHRLCKKYKLYNYFNPEFDKLVQEKQARLALEGKKDVTSEEDEE